MTTRGKVEGGTVGDGGVDDTTEGLGGVKGGTVAVEEGA